MNKKQQMASKMTEYKSAQQSHIDRTGVKEPAWKTRSGLKTKKAFTKLLASKDYKRDFINIDEYHEK